MSKRKVLLTGATGYLSSVLLEDFRDRYDLVLVDAVSTSKYGYLADVNIVDLTDENTDTYRHLFEGVDTIVHNAFYRTPGHITIGPRQWLEDQPIGDVSGYYAERDNLDMAYHIFKLALEKNVKRVVMTSSNHVTDWYETQLHCGKLDVVGPGTFPKSNNFYGWAKASYEHLGFVFATGRFGRQIENIQLRIGGPRPFIAENFKDNLVSFRRELGAYISECDLRQLYVKSIEAEDIADADDIPFQSFYGISNNARAFWSISNAREIIDYQPKDDSEMLYADDISRYLNAPTTSET